MTTIAEFLEARWTETEDAARAAEYAGSWFLSDGGPELADHFERHEPDYELKVIEANRAILAVHAVQLSLVSDYSDCSACMDVDTYDSYPCRTVRLLASLFSGHPDYQAEWAI